MEDSWPPTQGAVSNDLFVMAAGTASKAKPKIPGSSLETAVEDVHVTAARNSLAWKSVEGGQPLGAAPNLEYLRSVSRRTGDAVVAIWIVPRESDVVELPFPDWTRNLEERLGLSLDYPFCVWRPLSFGRVLL